MADSMCRAGLLPASMASLVRAAQRAHTLPWALSELGEMLAGRATRMVRRVSLVLSPMMVLGVGTIVGFIVLAMFLPLIQLLTRLS
jgi:type IV pilus assembly protein PilC